MPLVAENLPADAEILCEGCGYRLTGLPDEAACPECGTPVRESVPAGDGRHPPAWEPAGGVFGFVSTFLHVLLRPRRFFRSLTTRTGSRRSLAFAYINWIATALLGAAAGVVHGSWLVPAVLSRPMTIVELWGIGCTVFLVAMGALALLTPLAARFTFWEGRYWGYRLPKNAALRAMHYHTPHYLPVALLGFATTLTWYVGLRRGWFLDRQSWGYLYTLCGLVVLGAGYVFYTYTIAMRRIMWANR